MNRKSPLEIAKRNKEWKKANPYKVSLHNKTYKRKHKESTKIHNKTYKLKHKDESLGYRLKNKYGLSVNEYKRTLILQDNQCAICGKHFTSQNGSLKVCVDHDHKTGKIRGLLCGNCNVGLGMLGDSVTILNNAIKYLENF